MSPIADLRSALAALSHVPDETPVELTLAYGAPNALVYDEHTGVVRMSIGWGNASGRPTMGQLRTWIGSLPGFVGGGPVPGPADVPAELEGPWAIARGTELLSWRTALVALSAIASGFHGARRNGGSIFWGLVWFAAGSLFPVITPTIAVAQGYGRCSYNCYSLPTERR